MNKNIIISFIFLLIVANNVYSQKEEIKKTDKKDIVYVLDIKEQIGPAIWRKTKQAFSEANKIHAKCILLHMNTYGGLVDAADSLRTAILNSPIPVYVFIDNNAASAGALIAIACDSIYMRSGANIGAATVVNQKGEAVPDKYQSYMRSTMRSTAEAHGKQTIIKGKDTTYVWYRDPKIAEAMVDPRKKIVGIIDSGEVLTFTTSEAIKYNYCEGKAETIEEVIEIIGIKNYEIKKYNPSSLEKIIGILVNPYLQSVLIMILVGGIYFELQTPGVGFPLAASVIAAVIYFAPLYLEGVAEYWEIALFVLGLILLAIEIFAISGFGIAGVSGIILMVAGLAFSMVGKIDFSFSNGVAFSLEPLFKSIVIVVISMFTSVLASIFFGKEILSSHAFSFVSLNKSQTINDGYLGVKTIDKEIIGKEGIAITILRPSGKIEIDDEIYDAKAVVSYIERGTKVKVVDYKSGQLYVVIL